MVEVTVVEVTVVEVVRLRCSVRLNKNVAMSLWSLLGAKTLVTLMWLSATYLLLFAAVHCFVVFGLKNERKTN